jgi:hypothetical protein
MLLEVRSDPAKAVYYMVCRGRFGSGDALGSLLPCSSGCTN